MKALLIALLIPISVFASKYTTVSVATNESMGANVNSCGVDLNQLDLSSIQAVYTGSPSGSFKIQVSNDNVPVGLRTQCQSVNVVNWTDYTGSSVTIAAAGNTLYNMTFAGYHWVRLVYTRTSGTGTLNAMFSGKGVN